MVDKLAEVESTPGLGIQWYKYIVLSTQLFGYDEVDDGHGN